MAMTVAMALVGSRAIAAEANATLTRRVVVSLAHRKLAVIENGKPVEIFDVAVGKPSTPSPVGTFTIVNRVSNPTYYHPGKVVPPGPSNPLGTRWIGLSQKGYGIHGTDNPTSIGRAQSHGCIRLRNADVERLFERLRAGDVVELHAESSVPLEQLFAGS
jgi:lipoprotein-anchoring transpeptidase ErfK/SrfK